MSDGKKRRAYKLMKPITFGLKGKCKSRIRCRSFASLKIKQLEESIIEGNEAYEGLGDLEIPKKNEWVDVYIELNTLNPNIEMILSSFKKEKNRLEELVKRFEEKTQALKLDSTIPKISMSYIGETKVTETDYTTLEMAENMLFDYSNQLSFINECIIELTPS
jgi:hypothetical protein